MDKATTLSWTYKGGILPNGGGSNFPPALQAHNGKIWCAWIDMNNSRVRLATLQDGSTNSTFDWAGDLMVRGGDSGDFPLEIDTSFGGSATLCLTESFPLSSQTPILMLLVRGATNVKDDNGLSTFMLSDAGTSPWTCLPVPFQIGSGSISIAPFQDTLMLAAVRIGRGNFQPQYSVFSKSTGWGPMTDGGTNQQASSVCLVRTGEQVSMLLHSNGQISRYVYQSSSSSFVKSTFTGDSTSSEIRAANSNLTNGPAFITFVGYDSSIQPVCYCVYDGSWHFSSGIPGQFTYQTPAVTYLNGRVYCVYLARNSTNTLLWSIATMSTSAEVNGVKEVSRSVGDKE